MQIEALTAANARRWAVARVLTPKKSLLESTARRLVAARDRYESVSRQTGVPWYVIAVIHERESSQRWDCSIAQGDPWNEVSTHVPKGRGPFSSWGDAAIDALCHCAPYASRWSDWSAGGTVTLLEQYNGLGYANRGLPSPYIWAGTDQYERGKYVADGKFDPSVVDSQLGCAGLLLAMAEIDKSVAAGLGKLPTTQAPPLAPEQPKPQAKSILQSIIDVISSIFRR